MGGINAPGIELVFDIEEIPQDERSLYLQKILTFIVAAKEAAKLGTE